eukprot:s2133_g4.t1
MGFRVANRAMGTGGEQPQRSAGEDQCGCGPRSDPLAIRVEVLPLQPQKIQILGILCPPPKAMEELSGAGKRV